jgi:hypothetical protein
MENRRTGEQKNRRTEEQRNRGTKEQRNKGTKNKYWSCKISTMPRRACPAEAGGYLFVENDQLISYMPRRGYPLKMKNKE